MGKFVGAGQTAPFVGGVCGENRKKIVFDTVSDCTINDDKLRHSSRGFRSSGIAMSCFRGSRIGPVMNVLASVKTGILHAIHFNRFSDNPITIVTSLLNNINYGSANYQKNKLDISLSIDHGYNYGPVTDVLTELGTRFIGTHSEKFDKWPFGTGEKVFAKQKMIPSVGAKTVYVARKKVKQGEVTAHCFCNGNKLFGHVLTTEPVIGQWVLIRKNKNEFSDPKFSLDLNSKLYQQWLSAVTVITQEQANFPWFECRTGCLTGTTTKNIIRCVKFVIIDDADIGYDSSRFFNKIGIQFKRPVLATLQGK